MKKKFLKSNEILQRRFIFGLPNELFEENDIVIAFPQRDVHLDGQLTVINNPVNTDAVSKEQEK